MTAEALRKTIEFTPAKLVRLKEAYARHKDDEVMFFDGQEYIPSYVKYLIEYLETEFAR